MKIISPFHDYYDSVLKYQDDSNNIVYKRTPLEFKTQRLNKINKTDLIVQIYDMFKEIGSLNPHSYYYYYINPSQFTIKHTEYDFLFSTLLIVFCGKLYPCIEISKSNKIKTIIETNYIYNFTEFDKYLIDNDVNYSNHKFKNAIHRFLNTPTLNNHTKFLIENKITIAVITREDIFINCSLNNYHFYKVLDTYSAFQELNMWITGVLSYPQNIMVEVSNESKIEKAGFDKKTSFRKQPTKLIK